MAFNINKFRGAFNIGKQQYLVANSNYFEVQFMSLPRAFNSVFSKNEHLKKQLATEAFENMRFRCQHADLPGKMMTSMNRQFMGPARQMPYGATFQPVQLEFLETPQFNIRAFLDAWTELIEGYHNGYKNEYYDDVIMPEINIVMFARDGTKIARWTLYDCFPNSELHSSVSWEQSGNISVGTEIMFHRWESHWYPVSTCKK